MKVYFDENFSPNLIAGMRAFQEGRKAEGITVESIEEEFGRGTADEVWIPAVASQHGIAVTQDCNIHRTRAQAALCQRNKIGVFFLKPPKKGWSYWDIVQLVVRLWPQLMSEARTSAKPFGFVIEATNPKLKRL